MRRTYAEGSHGSETCDDYPSHVIVCFAWWVSGGGVAAMEVVLMTVTWHVVDRPSACIRAFVHHHAIEKARRMTADIELEDTEESLSSAHHSDALTPLTSPQATCLYISHFLSTWNARTYEFAVVRFDSIRSGSLCNG